MKRHVRLAGLFGLWAFALASSSPVAAQSGSLFQQERRQVHGQEQLPGQPPLMLGDSSWTLVEPPPVRTFRLHDIITVVVDQKSEVLSEGDVQRRKQSNFDAALLNWIKLRGLDIVPAPQSNGDLRIQGLMNQQYRVQNELETSDAIRFTIAAEVVDIRPNGNLVIEARKIIHNNNEVWEQSLTGVVRPEDVLPTNKVLSENIAELRIRKRELGHVRDGYRRGWLQRLWDRLKAF